MLNCADGCIRFDLGTGSSAVIKEGRRLLYVAMTRGRDALHLVVPQRFYIGGQASRGDRHVYTSRSRFISDDDVLGRFELRVWPASNQAKPMPHARRWLLSI